ncbi:uncharacterized protein V1513DRAFT_433022 [Lipomyces chichibuensis]|uniref:uncharacterized protein n=1 Tax=Lipomyces chichibuensis TaxID=1546026 RepID=UPI003342FF83
MDIIQGATAKEDPRESEISEVLEILRGPLPGDSLLEFIVSENGYKQIIEEREKSNRKMASLTKSQSIAVESYLHESTSLMVINSMVDEAVRVMRNAGVSDHVTLRIQNAGHLTTSTTSRRKSHKEPDGLIIFKDSEWRISSRIAFELGFSQSYSSLRQATMWWIERKQATVAMLLCLTEIGKSSWAAIRVFRTIEDHYVEIDVYGMEFNRQRREEHRPLGPLEYNGYKWFGTLRDAFFEIYQETDAGIHLVKDGVDVTDLIPRDLTVKVGDFVPHSWLNDDVVRRLAVNFLQPQTFMESLSNAILAKLRNINTICMLRQSQILIYTFHSSLIVDPKIVQRH